MKISHIKIQNYRNIQDIDLDFSQVTIIAGENNSGKSNLLRAITLPFISEEGGYNGKSLTWMDINNDAKDEYYEYLLKNKPANKKSS